MKVLLADSHPSECELFRGVLKKLGHAQPNILVVPSGRDTIEAVRTAGCDLVVADWGLPGSEGYALLRGLRKIPGGRGVAVLYCLSRADRAAADPVPPWEVLEFLERPLTPESFLLKLRKLEGEIETRRIQERSRTLLESAGGGRDGLPFFLQIPSAAMQDILDLAVHGTYPEGSTFIAPGEKVEFLNVITAGSCEADGRILGTGECIGGGSFLSRKPHHGAVRVRTKMHVASISRSRLAELVRRHPTLEGPLAELLSPADVPPKSTTDSEFRESHAAVSLPDVIQVLQRTRETGTLLTRQGSVRGGVILRSGEVRHAWTGSLTGPEAFHTLAGFQNPTFSFTSGATEGPRTVTQSTMSLLMETMGRLEESGRR
jgi:CheY-like chemotaxis protein